MSNLVGAIARVRFIDHDHEEISVQFTNGNISIINVGEEISEYEVGSVVSINDDYEVDLAPDDLWPDEAWVGIVRLKLSDITVVGSNGRWIKVPTNDVEYREGNTVEAHNSFGVVRVLSEDPIKYIDLPAIDDTVIEKFKSKEVGSETFDDFGGLQNVVERAKELGSC